MPFLHLNLTTSNAEHLLRNRLNGKFSSFTFPVRVLIRLLGAAFFDDCHGGTKMEVNAVKKACLVEQQEDRPRHKTSTRVTFNDENAIEECVVVESGRHADSSMSVKNAEKFDQHLAKRRSRILYGFKLTCLIFVATICLCSFLVECFQAFFILLPIASTMECLCFLLFKAHGMSSFIFVIFFLHTKKAALLRKGVGQISGGVGTLKHSRKIMFIMNISFVYLLFRSVALCALEYWLREKNFLRQMYSPFPSRPMPNNFNVVLLDLQRNGSLVDKMLDKSIVGHHKVVSENIVWKILKDSTGSCTLFYLALFSAIGLPLFSLPQWVLIAELSVLDREFAHDNNKYQLAVIRHYVSAHQNFLTLFRTFYTLLSVWISVQLLSTTSIFMGALTLLFKMKWSQQWNDVSFCLFALIDAISSTIFIYTTAVQLSRKLVTLKVKILQLITNQRLLSQETYTYIMAYQCFASDNDYCLKFCGLMQIKETFLLKFVVLTFFLFSAIRINAVL